ncbi:MAG: glycosyltransferase family 2 protein [Pseudomonadota bacterium]
MISSGLSIDSPKISVVLCSFNCEKYIAEQLESIGAQSRKPYEIIISDDGSSDKTLAVIQDAVKNFDFTTNVYVNDVRRGVVSNFGSALSRCSGDYIALSDHDDIWEENKLETVATAIEERKSDVPTLYHADPLIIGSHGKVNSGSFMSESRITYPQPGEEWARLAFANYIPGCTMIFDAKMLPAVLPFPGQTIMHDWWIALIFSLAGNVSRLPHHLMRYRLHDSNTMGVNTVSRSFNLGKSVGFSSVAVSNLAASLSQAHSARQRLDQLGLAYPDALTDLLRLPDLSWWQRPWRLLRCHASRGNPFRFASTVYASLVLDKEIYNRGSFDYR